MTLKPELGSLRVIGTDTYRSAIYQRSIATIGLSRTVSEIDGDFSRKLQKKIHRRVFCAPAEGVLIGIGYRRSRSKNQYDVATEPRKKFDDIFSHLDTMHQRVRRTE